MRKIKINCIYPIIQLIRKINFSFIYIFFEDKLCHSCLIIIISLGLNIYDTQVYIANKKEKKEISFDLKLYVFLCWQIVVVIVAGHKLFRERREFYLH